MNSRFLLILLLGMSFFSLPLYSQTEQPEKEDTTLLGLPGDNLDLYAVLDLFQKSKTIEDFEKALNSEEAGVNNLDLNLDKKVDFIKVVTEKDGDDFTFILQVDVSKTEKQDVGVILVSKDENKKITMQAVGDEDLYGKDFVVELNESVTAAVTANPGYKGEDAVITVPSTTTTVVVESAPIVQYVYSPAYVPYAPPYYYGYYPPYFFAFSVMAVGMYHHHHYHYHSHYGHGHYGHGSYHNHHGYNNYHDHNRNTSNTVRNNNSNGNYRGNSASTRPSAGAGASTRPSTGAGASTRPSTGAGASTRPSTGAGASTRPSTGASTPNGPTRSGTQPSNRASSGSSSSRPSTQPSYNSNRSSGSSSYGGSRGSGGYSGSSSRGGGGGSRGGGGGSRGGGGGRRG